MILTSLHKQVAAFVFFITLFLGVPQESLAQGMVTLSVSPTLFEMTASREQVWTSSVRVINSNAFPMTVYANPVNFKPSGESGQGTMVPVLETETNGETLAEWIDVDRGEIIVPPEQTVSIPFTISVPADAPPGGHFAAILVGTKPPEDIEAPTQVQTAQVVTSLVFLRVNGDIVESAQIRDFTTDSYIQEDPQANFSLRFENKGNVHLRPQGEIEITNMWGRERGVIPINKQSQFGNVLPNSIREYSFSWSGDWSLSDIGRYKAIVTLAYGDATKQFVTSELAFWVLPWKALLTVLLVLGAFIALITWSVKLYVRRMLQIAGITPELQHPARMAKHGRTVSVTAPIGESILDLRSQFSTTEGSTLNKLVQVVRTNILPILIAIAFLIFIWLFMWYLTQANSVSRDYEVVDDQSGQVYSNTDINEDQQREDAAVEIGTPTVRVINRSGEPELSKQVIDQLQTAGYETVEYQNENNELEEATVIVYDPAVQDVALDLRTLFTGALLSSFESSEPNQPDITVYIGSDLTSNYE